ncbi:hypothetical protein SPI_05808 [Niveomyces insectorum RCEF 264]|uniref:Uncharacterized protein n=1 Tax=Niveomyces insectorum RCEF 264 TaxID=1081102 RepID=A0A167SGP6_9HYPO|nr:hypothetical protein SPI_05808 [Niveomyces insectorum RCEF 264]
MGSSNSKPQKGSSREKTRRQRQQTQQTAAQVSGPTGGPVMVPPPYRDAGGRPIGHMSYDLDKDTITRALDDMAAHHAQKNVTAKLVTVGGAVNTLYLQSRDTTHDVDFFLPDPQSPDHRAIHEAARHANRLVNGALGGEWLNNSTQLMMGRHVQHRLANEAFQQNTIVYDRVNHHGGLRIYAAPWSYAFCGKLNRLCTKNPRPYDIADSVVYLHEYLQSTRQHKVGAKTVFKWCEEYGKNVTKAVLQNVDEAYYTKYGVRAIDWTA